MKAIQTLRENKNSLDLELGLEPLGNCKGIHFNLGLFSLDCLGCNEIKLKKAKILKFVEIVKIGNFQDIMNKLNYNIKRIK